MSTRVMKRIVGSVACLAASAMLLPGTIRPAQALEADGRYYSSKQPYVAPNDATASSYSKAPKGYGPIYTESMARHGSRGLSSYKYDALLMRMAETAARDGGFKSEAIKAERSGAHV